MFNVVGRDGGQWFTIGEVIMVKYSVDKVLFVNLFIKE